MDEELTIKVTASELALFREVAANRNLTVEEWAREALAELLIDQA
jgi:hypothetical protein